MFSMIIADELRFFYTNNAFRYFAPPPPPLNLELSSVFRWWGLINFDCHS